MRKIFFSVVLLLVVLLLPFPVFAAEKDQVVFLPKNETVTHDYFASGGSIDIEGTVNGDVYVAGGNILVNGRVNGDVLAAGGQVTIRGEVQNVRVAGGQVVIDGKVNGNITAAGGNITITDAAVVSGSLVGAGGQYNILGPIGKTVSLAAGQVTIGNSVGSDVWISGQHITFTPQAKVNGNVAYVSNQKAAIENGASISGKLNQSFPPEKERPEPSLFAAFAGLRLAFSLISFLVSLVVGLLLLSLTPVYVGRVLEHIARHPWQSLVIGVVAWILTPLVVFILLITLIGIPFAVLVGIVIAILSYIGSIIGSIVIGKWLVSRFSKRENMFIVLLVGLIIVEIVGLIPVIGWLFTTIVTGIGFGAILFMEQVYYTELRAKKVI